MPTQEQIYEIGHRAETGPRERKLPKCLPVVAATPANWPMPPTSLETATSHPRPLCAGIVNKPWRHHHRRHRSDAGEEIFQIIRLDLTPCSLKPREAAGSIANVTTRPDRDSQAVRHMVIYTIYGSRQGRGAEHLCRYLQGRTAAPTPTPITAFQTCASIMKRTLCAPAKDRNAPRPGRANVRNFTPVKRPSCIT